MGSNSFGDRCKLNNHCDRQWGVNITSASSTKTVNYPLAYNRIPVVIPAHFQDVGASADIQAGNATMTGFDGRIAYVDNRTQSTLVADKFTWVSIGK